MSKFSSASPASPTAGSNAGSYPITVKIVLEQQRQKPFTGGATVVLTGPTSGPPARSAPVTSNASGIASFSVQEGRYMASATHPGWSFVPDGTVQEETNKLTLLAVEKKVTWGVDTNLVLTDDGIAFAKQQRPGLTFIGRYVSLDAQGHPKLTRQEAQRYAAHGLDVVALFERRAKEATQGGTPDKELHLAELHLGMALDQMEKAGGSGEVIYFTCDFSLAPSKWKHVQPLISAYFGRLAKKLPPSQLGVYGPYTVLDHLFKEGLVQWGWQQIFGSPPGAIHPKANLCQYDIYPDINGYTFKTSPGAGALDLDVVMTPAKGFGGFRPH